MALLLSDRYIWDFWTIRHGDVYHVFYLQAPRTPHDPELRHASASVGHAVSDDLTHWKVLPDALLPGPAGAWDDRAIWTGSVVEKAGSYYMFYTSTSRAEQGKVQRIGLATSQDLIHWQRHPANPIIEADPEWYEKSNEQKDSDEAWRDPYVYYDGANNIYYALICARVNAGHSDGRGAIGLAKSGDLIEWEVMPPLYAGGEFTQMEVPQLIKYSDRYHLLFSTGIHWHSAARRERLGGQGGICWGTYALSSDQLLGNYAISSETGLAADQIGTHFAGKIEFNPAGRPVFLATRQLGENSQYLGSLSDPMPVVIDSSGKLAVIMENYG